MPDIEGTPGVPDETPPTPDPALAPGFRLVASIIIEAIQDPTGSIGIGIKSTTPDRVMMLDMLNKMTGHLIQKLDEDRQSGPESPDRTAQKPTLWIPGADGIPPPRWRG